MSSTPFRFNPTTLLNYTRVQLPRVFVVLIAVLAACQQPQPTPQTPEVTVAPAVGGTIQVCASSCVGATAVTVRRQCGRDDA